MGTRLHVAALLLVAGLALAGCETRERTPGVDARVGDMGDRSWGGLRGKPPRPSAAGGTVAMESFEGRFVWAEYAAPWCAPCRPQAAEVRGLDGSLGGVVFLTVMTSERGGYGHPATRETAKRWASEHGLDPNRVVAADLTSLTVPRHILFSPEGHMLFEKTGLLRAGEIRNVIEERRRDFEAWRTLGDYAGWMR